MRNATFRIAYNLDRNTWKVEAGDPETLVFSSPEEREKHDEEISDMMSRFTKRELEEGAGEEIVDQTGRFEGLLRHTSSQKFIQRRSLIRTFTPWSINRLFGAIFNSIT